MDTTSTFATGPCLSSVLCWWKIAVYVVWWLETLNISHKSVGFGVFPGRQFEAREIVGYYCNTLVYSNRMTQTQVQKMFDNGVMSVTVDNFSILAFKVPKTFLGYTVKKTSASIVTTRLCRMRFPKNSHYLPEDKFTEMQRRMQPREYNISVVQISFPDSALDLKDCQVIAVKALQYIEIGEQLYLDYGSGYRFSLL